MPLGYLNIMLEFLGFLYFLIITEVVTYIATEVITKIFGTPCPAYIN